MDWPAVAALGAGLALAAAGTSAMVEPAAAAANVAAYLNRWRMSKCLNARKVQQFFKKIGQFFFEKLCLYAGVSQSSDYKMLNEDTTIVVVKQVRTTDWSTTLIYYGYWQPVGSILLWFGTGVGQVAFFTTVETRLATVGQTCPAWPAKPSPD